MKLLKKLAALIATTAIISSGAQISTLAETATMNLGAKIFNENGTLQVEVGWENDESNPPLVVVAEYDEDGRLMLAHRIDANGGYCKTDTGIVPSGAETKLFVWDSKTNKPIYDTVTYEEVSEYVFPASEYVPQSNRSANTRFSNGGGILLDTLGTIGVSPSAELYVNNARYFGEGILIDELNQIYEYTITDDILDKFLANAQGDVRLEKSDSSTGKYDRIYVDYYEVAQVTYVSYRNGLTTLKLNVMNDVPDIFELRFPRYCTFEIEDTSIESGQTEVYAERNNQEASLKELRKGDAVAFAMDFDGLYSGLSSVVIQNPASIKVLATDKIITGTVIACDDYYGTYTIDDTTYKYVGFANNLTIDAIYELPLDPFGRILNEGTLLSTGYKFAIVEKYIPNTEQVQLLLADGTTATYEVNSSSEIDADALPSFIKTGSEMNPVCDRVVTYKMTGDSVRLSTNFYSVQIIDKKYNINTGKLGSVPITNKISTIDAHTYVGSSSPKITDYQVFDLDTLKTDVSYSGCAYKTGDVYEFMILTSTGETFTRDSRFAVITKDPVNKMYDGEVCVGVEALYNGEATTLYSNSNKLSGYGEGDVVFFTTDPDGYLESIHKIYDKDTGINTAQSAFESMPGGSYKASNWNFNFATSTADIQLVSGYVTEVERNYITLGLAVNGEINGNLYNRFDGAEGTFSFGIADDCQAYTFDESYDAAVASKKYSITDVSSIAVSDLVEKRDDEGNTIDGIYDVNESTLNDAIAMIVDGDVVCIFVNYPL